jgi:hypothetical protein
MANYFWNDVDIDTTIHGTQITSTPAALGVAQPQTALGNIGLYDMTFNYLTNFHVNTPTQPSLQYVNLLYNNVNPTTQATSSIFPITLCPTRAVSDFTSGGPRAITLGNANRMYVLLVGAGGGGGGGGGGGNTYPNANGGAGAGGGAGALMGFLVNKASGVNTASYSIGAGGNGGAAGRTPTVNIGNGGNGNAGGPTTFNYNGISYIAAGGGGGDGGNQGTNTAPAGTTGNGGSNNYDAATATPSSINPVNIQSIVSGAIGTNGSPGNNSGNGFPPRGSPGAAGAFAFVNNTPTSYYLNPLQGRGGQGAVGYRSGNSPTPRSASAGNGGQTGTVTVFFYYD